MASGDKVIDIDGVKYSFVAGRLDAIERENKEMHAEIRTVNEKLDLLLLRVQSVETRLEDLKFFVSLTFGALAVFVGVIALVPFAGKILEALKKPTITEERVNELINQAVSKNA